MESEKCQFGDGCSEPVLMQARFVNPETGRNEAVVPLCEKHAQYISARMREGAKFAPYRHGGSIQFTDVPGQMICRAGGWRLGEVGRDGT